MRRDLPGAVEIDATDGDERYARGARSLMGLLEQRDADRRIGAFLGCRAEHGPERHVVWFVGERSFELFQIVCRDAYEQSRSNQAYDRQRQIFLTDVYAITPCEHREVRSIIGDQPGACRAT